MRESWGSRFGFIMATAGFAVGLGNIWRFPYLTGTNGGGAWVLVYICAILIGIVSTATTTAAFQGRCWLF